MLTFNIQLIKFKKIKLMRLFYASTNKEVG